jgi:hypothetical protein
MAEFLKLFADPDRMCARLHRYTRMRHVRKPLFDRLRCRSEAATVYDFTVVVESAVMAPDISKVYADRNDKPRLSARNFDDEVLRWLRDGKQSPPSRGPAHPISRHSRPCNGRLRCLALQV